MTKIGKLLKKTREERRMTLRKVHALTGISSAYLSQVENAKIKKPSPSVLHKLSTCYSIPYENLLELCGHPAPIVNEMVSKPSFRVKSWTEDLSKDEEEMLKEYLDFLRSRRKR